MDPHIKPFEVLKEDDEEVVVRTGFEAVIRKKFADPMPEWLGFETDTIEKTEAFEFDDPWDDRRYFSAGDNQIAGVGDGFARNSPGLDRDGQDAAPRLPGLRQRVRGERVHAAHHRPGEPAARGWGCTRRRWAASSSAPTPSRWRSCKAQIKAADGLLDGIVIWGDVAYKKDLFFSPKYWRKYYKPGVKALVDEAHAHGLPVIYHGCGNVKRVFEDFIEMGVDAYNPLEAKAGLDVVELRRQYGHRIGFCGNMDVHDLGAPARSR